MNAPRFASAQTVIAASLLLAMAGCVIHIGSRSEDVDAAWTAAGTSVRLGMQSGNPVEGELLAATDSAMIVRTTAGVVLARYEQVFISQFGSPTVSLDCCRKATPEQVARLRLVSRYPQGLSPELTAKLLSIAGQPAMLERRE